MMKPGWSVAMEWAAVNAAPDGDGEGSPPGVFKEDQSMNSVVGYI